MGRPRVGAGHAPCNGQHCVIALDIALARPEQLELQTASQSSLVDVRQQRVHLGLAGQLFFKLRHVLLNLFALLFERLKVDSLIQFFAVVFAQLDFTGFFCCQLFI